MADEPRRTEDLQEEEPVEKIDLGASLRKEHKAKKPVNRLAVLVTAGAVIVLAAVLAIFLPGLLNQEEENVQTESQAVALSDHVSGDVVSIHIDGENTFTITKEEVTAEDGTADEVFHVDILDDALLNQSTCSAAFVNAADMEADQLVEADAQDLSTYGLDNPSCTLTVNYSDNTSLVLELGDVQSLTGQIYACVQGENDVYILRPYFANIFGGSLLRYRSLEMPEISTDITNTASVVIEQEGQDRITFQPAENPTTFATGTWQMTEPRTLWLDSGAVSELVMSVSDCGLYEYLGTVDDLADYGLDTPWFSITVTDLDGSSRTLRLGDLVEGDDIHYYCTIDDTNDVFTISTSYLAFAEDFQVTHYLDMFTNIISITEVDRVDVTDGTTAYTMTIERQEQYDEDGTLKTLANGSPDYLETFFLDGAEVQEDAFKTAYQTIIGVTISGLVDEELVDESQTPVLTVTYTFNNGTEPITVEYLPYDINNYCVRREGSVDLICKKDQVDSILPTMADLAAGNLDEEEE